MKYTIETLKNKYGFDSEHELINLYKESKDSYYNDGTSILTDFEFDELENVLLHYGKIDKNVGIISENILHEKIPHYYSMLSLDKIKSKDSTDLEIAISDLYKWIVTRKRHIQSSNLFNTNIPSITITPKYDGNAINLQFSNSKFERALSRGNGKEGRNITEYIEPLLSKKIKEVEFILNGLNIKDKLEVRGELIIKNETFVSKYYGDYKNPRNFIAGILNNKTTEPEIFEDCDVFFFDLKYEGFNSDKIFGIIESEIYNILSTSPKKKKELKLDSSFNIGYLNTIIEECQNEFLSVKDYEHDGLVFSLDSSVRFLFPDKSTFPDHSIAFKFEPECAYTEVTSIEWNTGTSSKIVPTVHLKPVDLVGTTISKVTGFNAKYILENNLQKGSLVKIAKAGDIIPIIIDVLPSPVNKNSNGENVISCTCGNYSAKLKDCVLDNDIHLTCEVLMNAMPDDEVNPTKECHAFYKLYETRLKAFNINGLGPAYIKDFYSCPELQMDIMDFFFKSKDLMVILLKNDIKITKNHKTIIESIQPGNIDINIWNIVYSLCVDNLGKSVSKEIEKYLTGDISYNFSGFNKGVVSLFTEEPYTGKIKVLEKIKKLLELGYTVLPDKIGADTPTSTLSSLKDINIEMTGTPPREYGIKNKFVQLLNEEAKKINIKFVPTKIASSKILVTDDLKSKSTKMNTALRKKMLIYTYKDLYESVKNKELTIINQLSIL